jgi:hypothetical protein
MRIRKLKKREKLYFIKVDQPGPTLYVHPLEDGYEVRDYKEGAALWRDEADAILFVKQMRQLRPEIRLKLEVLKGGSKL